MSRRRRPFRRGSPGGVSFDYFGVTSSQIPNSVICRQLSIGGPEGDCYTPRGPQVLGLLIKSESYLTSLLPCHVKKDLTICWRGNLLLTFDST